MTEEEVKPAPIPSRAATFPEFGASVEAGQRRRQGTHRERRKPCCYRICYRTR
jgi:hypothetical protein